jgi:O-antigen/teichoic acid export membrane protein
LTVLTVLSVFRPITWVLGAYMEAQDRTGRLMWLELAKVILLIGGLFALRGFGLHWAATAVGIAYGVTAIAGVFLVAQEGPSIKRLAIGFMQPLIACAAMAGAVLGVRQVLGDSGGHPGLLLLAEIGVGVVVYVGVALVVCRSTAMDLLRLAKAVIKRRRGASEDAA